MWRNVVQTICAHWSAFIGFVLSVMAHLIDTFLRPLFGILVDPAPVDLLPRKRGLIARPVVTGRKSTSILATDSTRRLSGLGQLPNVHISFSPDAKSGSIRPGQGHDSLQRPALLKTISTPVPTRSTLNVKASELLSQTTVVPVAVPTKFSPQDRDVRSSMDSEEFGEMQMNPSLKQRCRLRRAKSAKTLKEKFHHRSPEAVTAPIPRTQPYGAPYFFPSPDSPDAADYARRVMEERRSSQRVVTLTTLKELKEAEAPSSVSSQSSNGGSSAKDFIPEPPKSAGLAPEANVTPDGKRRPGWKLGRRVRPASFHAGDFSWGSTGSGSPRSSILGLPEVISPDEMSETEPTFGKKSFFSRKPRTS